MKSVYMAAMVAVVCCHTVSCSRDKDAALLRQVRIGDTNAILSCLKTYTNINHLFSDESEPGAYASLLHAAVEYGHPEVVRILVEHRADVDVRDSRGRTPLMWVVGLTENDVDIATREQTMMLLLKAHATSDLSDKYGYTPLIWASMLGKTTLVRILLDAGAKVNLTDQNGESALHVAKTPDIARFLLKAGADVQARSKNNETPIETAIREKRFAVLPVLTNANWPGGSQ